MTKKHFEALAAALKDGAPSHMVTLAHVQWEADCESLANVCARFNPNFDRARFLKACGVEKSEK